MVTSFKHYNDIRDQNAASVLSTCDCLFLAHLSHWLRVSYCDHWMSVVRPVSCVVPRQQLLQMTSPKLMAGF